MRLTLDACVLYPNVLRGLLLGVARLGHFEPVWSPRILEEWARATIKLGEGAELQARGEIAVLRAQWPRAEVEPRTGGMARLWLPDENDIHVLAAAIASSSDAIVTLNAKDFPRGALRDEGIERLAPDEVLMGAWSRDADQVEALARSIFEEVRAHVGEEITLRGLMKRARVPRFGKAISA